MRGRRFRLLLSWFAGALLLLSVAGCSSGTRVDSEIKVGDDGSIEQELKLRGVSISEGSKSALEDQWEVKTTDSGTTLNGAFPGVESYGEAISLASSVLRDEFTKNHTFSPQVDSEYQVRLRSTDFLVAKRNVLEVTMPTVQIEPQACIDCGGAGFENCGECGGKGITTCGSCEGDGVWESYWGDSQCGSCGGSGNASCYACDGDGRLECYTCGGTGQPDQESIDYYSEVVSSLKADMAITMPGLRARTEDGSEDVEWSLASEDVLGGETYAASSWSIRWPFAIPTVLLLVAACAMLAVVAVKRVKAAVPARVVASATPRETSARFCTSCGARNDAAAEFCTSCGTSMKAS